MLRFNESNFLADQGHATCFHLDSGGPLDVRYVMAVAEIPEDFDCVETISMGLDESAVLLRSTSGTQVSVRLDLTFLQSD